MTKTLAALNEIALDDAQRLAAVRKLITRFEGCILDCWLWSGPKNAKGYGTIYFNGTTQATHRLAYAAIVGPLPPNKVLDHLCRNRACFNPEHLEVVTSRENTRRGIGPQLAAQRMLSVTHCPKGHPYDEANTKRAKDGSRTCRECHRAAQRARYRRLKAFNEGVLFL
jgi:hypothetical protein